MADPKIKVEIEADIKGLQAGVNQAEKELSAIGLAADIVSEKIEDVGSEFSVAGGKLSTFANTADKVENQLKDIGNATELAENQIADFGNKVQATAPKIDKATKATSNFNAVGTDFARILQDAPFGIIGVSNNITQLASSFGSARAKGESIPNILKGIFSGGNLLTIGISALTSAFVVLEQQGFFRSQKAAESLSEALDEYRKKLDSVTRSSIEGQANSQKEIQSFNLLRAQAENTNIPLNARLEAVRDLKKEFPEYLSNLTNEQILTGKVGGAYDELTKSITATAKARAFSDQIAKNSLDLLTLEQEAQERVNTLLQKQTQLAPLLAAQANQAAKSRGEFTGLDLQILDLQKEIRDLQLEQVENIENANKLKTESEKLESKITEQIVNGAKFTQTQLQQLKEVKRTYEEIQTIQTNRPPVSFNPSTTNVAGINTENIQSDINALNALKKSLDESGLSFEQFNQAIANGAAEGFDSLGEFIQKLAETQEFINNTFGILEQGIENTIGDIAFSIGNALAEGANVAQAAGVALLGSLAGVLNQLGQLAIGTGIAIAGIKKALQTLNPAVAIAGGVALVALAGFVSSKARGLANAGSSGGGSFSGASGLGTTFSGQGATGLQFDRSLQLSGEFRVKGQDLVYVFNEASTRNQKG